MKLAPLVASLTILSCPGFAQPTGSACSVRIAQPSAAQKVSAIDDVKGTASNIPIGTKLWVLAHRRGLALWWPQNGGSVAISGERWGISAYFGEARDVGADFEVTARVFDDKNNAALEAWVKKATETGQYPGITMPPSVASCGDETVTVNKAS